MKFEAGRTYVSNRAIILGFGAIIEVLSINGKHMYIRNGRHGKPRRMLIKTDADGMQYVMGANSPYAPSIFADNR